jgi:uncharacterized membrane protein YtjA (UPF0391 family)
MLRATIIFMVLALVSGLFGFGIVYTRFDVLAQLMFWVFAILFGATLLSRLINDQSARDVFN